MIDQEKLKAMDIANISQTIASYHSILDSYNKGIITLTKDDIEYFTSKILEQTSLLKEYIDVIYDELTPEEKAIVDAQLQKNNS